MTGRGDDVPQPVSITAWDTLSLGEAALAAGVSQDTVARWCRRYGIGRQLTRGSRWRVSGPALRMLVACDTKTLEDFRDRRTELPSVAAYLSPAKAAPV